MPILEATLPQSAASLATPTRRSKRSVLVGVHAGCCKLADLYSVGVNKGAVADLPTCFQWQQRKRRSAQYWRQNGSCGFGWCLPETMKALPSWLHAPAVLLLLVKAPLFVMTPLLLRVCVSASRLLALHSKLGLPPSCCVGLKSTGIIRAKPELEVWVKAEQPNQHTMDSPSTSRKRSTPSAASHSSPQLEHKGESRKKQVVC